MELVIGKKYKIKDTSGNVLIGVAVSDFELSPLGFIAGFVIGADAKINMHYVSVYVTIELYEPEDGVEQCV